MSTLTEKDGNRKMIEQFVVYRADIRIHNYKLQVTNYGIPFGNDFKFMVEAHTFHLSFVIYNFRRYVMFRLATERDLPAILEIYGPYVLTTTVSFEYTVPAEAEFLQRFREITAQFPWLVYEEAGKVLGYAYASRPYGRAAYSWCAEPSVYLAPEAKGRGIAGTLYHILEECLKLQGYQLLYALVTSENFTSLRFHEKMGYFTRVCFPDCAWKFGRSLGVNWMEKRLCVVDSPSNFPVPWPEIMQDSQKFSDILDTLSIS